MFFLLSSVETGQIYFDSDMSDQEFDCLDDDNDSDLASDLDEDFLLKEETELKQDGKDANRNVGGFSAYVDYSDVPLAQDYAEEEEDDVISLHPDDSLLDEEDELGTNSNRLVHPRLVSMSCIFVYIPLSIFFAVGCFFDQMPGLQDIVRST